MHERPERPTPAEFLGAFDGRIYGVTGPVPVSRNLGGGQGWGRSGNEVSHLRLSYRVGRQRQRVDIDINRPHRANPRHVLSPLIFQELLRMIDDSTEFPLDLRVDRIELVIPVQGEDRLFTGFTFGAHTAAIGEIDDFTLTVHGPTQLVPRIKLGVLDPERLMRWLEAGERRVGKPARRRGR